MVASVFDAVATLGNQPAIVDAGEIYRYRDLADLMARSIGSLSDAGVGPGTVVALETTHSSVAAAALLALVDLRAICVPMTRLPAAKRAEYLTTGQVEAIAHIPDGESTPTVVFTGMSAAHPLYAELRDAGHPGLVLFSSGTTGASKASVLDFARILARYGRRGPGRRTLSFLNFDHVGGINTLLHTLSQGGTIVTLDDRSPDNVFRSIERYRVQVLPTTPTFLTMALIDSAYRRYDASSLELVTYGTEPMPAQTLQRMAERLPHVEFKQTYGLSELGILSSRSRANNSLWLSLGGSPFDYKVVDGVLWVRSEMAMLGYLNAAAPFDADGYFNTQDAVEVDGEYLRILGRTSELINVGGEKVYPNEVESVLLEIDNIADVMVHGARSAVTGQVVAATVRLVHAEDTSSLRRRIEAHCRSRLEPFKVPAKVVVTDTVQHSDRFKKARAVT